jgi:natural product biosynthesis luciferase-like monooxygenase protein
MSDMGSRLSSLSENRKLLLEEFIKRREKEAINSKPIAEKRKENTSEGVNKGPSYKKKIKPMEFSIFFFADDSLSNDKERYRLLIESAKYADKQGFSAVWTPERHFHAFGGLYPNPSVLGAALSMVTEHLEIRAGSLVLPLHHPARVVEEWAVVDNLSNGRAAIALASGWHPKDFSLIPENYNDRKKVMYRYLETLQKLWAGETVQMKGVGGKEVHIRTFPHPIRKELPIWISSAGNIETFENAGKRGLHILTSLINQTLEELGKKIVVYREILEKNGYDPSLFKVSLMIHTYIDNDLEQVKLKVREPITEYLRTNLDLHATMSTGRSNHIDANHFSKQDEDAILGYAFERYFNQGSLLGTTETCREVIQLLQQVGVDECACLIDFGLDTESALGGLIRLNEFKNIL